MSVLLFVFFSVLRCLELDSNVYFSNIVVKLLCMICVSVAEESNCNSKEFQGQPSSLLLTFSKTKLFVSRSMESVSGVPY